LLCRNNLTALKTRYGADIVVMNADGATHGGGLGRNHAAYLRKIGADLLTLGDFSFYKKDLTQNLPMMPYVIRPYNLVKAAPGHGVGFARAANGKKLAVIELLGQVGFKKTCAENPYQILNPLLDELRQKTPFLIVEFHALATAEKKTLCMLADGHCSAVIGSHTRVQTADARVLPGGTACITDAGRTGSRLSVGGLAPEIVIQEYLTGIPAWSREANTDAAIQGVVIQLGEDGRALSIERFSHSYEL
jgi:metallophosphoesterase (TIGR00282 family)